MSNYVHKDDCKIEVKFSNFSAWFSKNGAISQNTVYSFSSSTLNFQVLLNDCLRTQYTISTNDLCHEKCRVMFIKMTPKSNFLLVHPKMVQLVKIAFYIVFPLARLMFTGQ